MSLNDFSYALEHDIQWRIDEIRYLENNLERNRNDIHLNSLRRSIICIMYAHIEGFLYFSFTAYISHINQLNLRCKDVVPSIATANLHKELKILRVAKKKNSILCNELPDDTELHKLSREIEFIEKANNIFSQVVKIPEKFISTENNVGSSVLKKLLYQVGLDVRVFSDGEYETLNKLLIIRNNISHGKIRDIDELLYSELKDCFDKLLERIKSELILAFGNEEFLLPVQSTEG
jgi:RiboL-PSP-HEPN